MADLKHIVEQFSQRGQQDLETWQKENVANIKKKMEELNQLIQTSSTPIALSPWKSIDETAHPSSPVVPEKIYLGSMQLETIDGSTINDIDIPLLLPLNTNAVLMDLRDDAIKVPKLFQNILIRMLLTMRMDLLKVSVVDLDFGSSFPIVSMITNPMFKSKIVYRNEDINKLIDDLAKEVNEANKTFLGHYSDINTYNTNNGDMASPYHIVFIDDFPNGFTTQSIDNLLRLIDNGNAFKAGIRIFINYDRNNPHPHEFDLNKFIKSSAYITKGDQNNILFKNIDVKIPKHVKTQMEWETPSNIISYTNYINNIKPKTISYSLDDWIENLKNSDQVWNSSTIDGINIPIGYISPTQHFNFYMANDNDGSCNDFFALIAGRPGYGKTVLLHNIIVNAAMKYSPKELILYLADFAEGASFSTYRDLPHVKALMLANNKEYALRMLKDVALEAKKRSHLYQKAQKQYGRQVTKLSEYREVTGEKLPRILFIIDEFHTLFLSTDNTTLSAKEELCNGIRQWRKFGISAILCTQSINGVNFGNADTQITYRFALNLLELDSKSVIRNAEAKTLLRKGQTIMNNTADGRIDANVEFQSAYSTHYLDHVKYLAGLYLQKYNEKHTPYLCESGTEADIYDNPIMLESFLGETREINPHYCDIYVGKPDLLRETHTKIRYRRQQYSNTLILGDDYRVLVYNIMLQLLQLKHQSHPNSKFYIVDSFNPGDRFQGQLNEITTISDNIIPVPITSVSTCIDEIFDELERRKIALREGKMTEERIVLTILNAQNTYELKPRPARIGNMMEQSDTSKKLVSLLLEGAPLGIHCIIHGLSYETAFKNNGIFDGSKHFSMFENLILLKGTDMGNIYVGGSSLKLTAPEEGQMIVINAKVDGEAYEQCNAYSDITTEKKNKTIEYITNIFEKFRYE